MTPVTILSNRHLVAVTTCYYPIIMHAIFYSSWLKKTEYTVLQSNCSAAYNIYYTSTGQNNLPDTITDAGGLIGRDQRTLKLLSEAASNHIHTLALLARRWLHKTKCACRLLAMGHVASNHIHALALLARQWLHKTKCACRLLAMGHVN